MKRVLAMVAVVAIVLTWSADARACTPVRGYRIPFNFELVEEADLIVLARVKSGPGSFRGQGPPPPGGALTHPPQAGVTLTPLQVFKGRLPAGELRVFGVTSNWGNGVASDWGKPVLPAFTKLTEAHPSSYEGACIRKRYPVGGLLVAMFRNTPTGPAQLNYPFAREIEDVESGDAVWVRAVRLYVSVLSHPAGRARRTTLAAAERSLLSNRNDPGGAAIASDIRSYLSHRNPHSLEPGGMP